MGSISFAELADLGVTDAAVNLTVTETGQAGFLRASPCGTDAGTSNINYEQHDTVAAAAIVGLSDDSEICLTTSANTHLLIDVTGLMATGPLWVSHLG